MRIIAIDDPSVCQSVMQVGCAKTAKWIDDLFGVETSADRGNIARRGGGSLMLPLPNYFDHLFLDFAGAEDEIWICKPTGRNQGKGIFLVRSLLHLQQADAENDEQNAKQKPQKKPMSRIIQRCVSGTWVFCVS